jgi:hypothetical protein
MIRIFTFLLLQVSVILLSAQETQLKWTAHGTSPGVLFGEGVAVDPAGNAYFTGFFNSQYVFMGDTVTVASIRNSLYLTKVSADNQFQWTVTATADGINGVNGFKTYYTKGFVYVIGDFRGTATFGSRDFTEIVVSGNEYRSMFVAKYTENGVLEWVKTLTTDNSIGMVLTGGTHDLVVDDAGAVYVSTQFRNSVSIDGILIDDPTPDENLYNALLFKLDNNGAYQWHWNTINSGTDQGQALVLSAKNTIYVAVRYSDSLTVGGNVHAREGTGGFALLEFDLLGNYVSHKFMTTATNLSTGVRCFSMALGSEGEIYMAGSYRTDIVGGQQQFLPAANTSRSDGFLIKINPDNLQWDWAKFFGSADENDDVKGIYVMEDNTLLMAGSFKGSMLLSDGLTLNSFDESTDGFWATLFDSGQVIEAASFGGSSNEWLSQLAVTSGGDAFMIGRFQDEFRYNPEEVLFSSWNGFDYFVVKIGKPSSDTSLSEIMVDGDAVNDFDSEIFDYSYPLVALTSDVPHVSAIPNYAGAMVEIEQALSLNGTPAERTATITVTSETGTESSVYTVTFRLMSNDANLAAIYLDGDLLNDFYPDTISYTISIESFDDIPAVTADPANENAWIDISEPANTTNKENFWLVFINVTSEDQTQQKEYILKFRELSVNADLAAIFINNEPLDGFTPDSLDYIVNWFYEYEGMPMVNATAESEHAQIELTQMVAFDGNDENQTATILVTAENQIYSKTYTVYFNELVNDVAIVSEKSLMVYPNPVYNDLNVVVDDRVQRISVYNIFGQEIMTFKNPLRHLKLNMGYFPDGIYFVRLFDENQRNISSASFIKKQQ